MNYGDSFFFMAQAIDPISGGAGWVGAGLLGLVMGWLLLVHLPSKDKQLGELIAEKDRQLAEKDKQIVAILENNRAAIQAMIQENSATIKALTTEFRASMKDVAEHCEKESIRLIDIFDKKKINENNIHE